MMPQVRDVVTHEILECCCLGFINCFECDAVKIMLWSRLPQCLLRDNRDQVGQVKIIMFPQLNELLPWLLVVSLFLNPLGLLVSLEDEFAGQLCAYETLMVIAGGVNQVAKDLLWRPFVLFPFQATLIFGNISQA